MERTTTNRGFALIEFEDLYEHQCSIQESSLASKDAIWMGIDDANPQIMASKVREDLTGWLKYPIPEDVMLTTRMHIDKEQAKEIIEILQTFVDTGRL
jgi:hypothetical protein